MTEKQLIHSNNAEIIDILDNNNIELEDKTFLKYFKESIKCIHIDIANYFHDKLLTNHDSYNEIRAE